MSYDTEVALDSPIAYWKLDETSGTTAADSSGNGHTGTYNGSPSLAQPAIAGTNVCPIFDGVNDYVDCGTIDADNTGNATLEFWMNPTVGPTGGLAPGIAGIHVSEANKLFARFFDTNLRGETVMQSGNFELITTTAAVSASASWHVVLVQDGGTNRVQKLYLNGSQVATTNLGGATTQVLTAVGNFVIGRDPFAPTKYFSGKISNVAVYSTALSAARVTAHYAAAGPLTVAAPPLIAPPLLLPAPASFPAPISIAAPPMLAAARLSPPTVVVPVRTPIGRFTVDPSQAWGFDLGTRIDVSTVEPDDGPGPRRILRTSETYPNPVLVDGRPT